MCGRYFTDPSVAKELYDIFKIPGTKDVVPAAEDIHPADTADVLISTPKGIGFEKMRWGFPGFEKNKLIFNARAEGALEKRCSETASAPKEFSYLPAVFMSGTAKRRNILLSAQTENRC